VWHAYVRMERAAGQLGGARAVYKRCYTRSFDGDTVGSNMCTSWLRLEREAGSAADYAAAEEKVSTPLPVCTSNESHKELRVGHRPAVHTVL
jgi:hypothetical protein